VSKSFVLCLYIFIYGRLPKFSSISVHLTFSFPVPIETSASHHPAWRYSIQNLKDMADFAKTIQQASDQAMSTSRIYSLCPSLCRSAGAVELGPIRTSVRHRPTQTAARKLYVSAARRQDDVGPQRYGTANAPPPHLLGDNPRAGRSAHKERPARSQEAQADAMPEKEISAASTPSEESKPDTAEETPEPPQEEELPKKEEPLSSAATPVDPPPPNLKVPDASPKETVLAMPAPSEVAEEDKPPHLQAPPYVHHFDTWTLVRSLQTGGFTQDQSTTVMKAVRTILADNMDLARRGLVSKSNVENETYLFRAACSELKTEVQNNRKSEADKERTQRAQLQHEVDIMNQRTTQESANLKDELKGMFDDRKMAVRMEQRNMERKVCTSKISVSFAERGN
jgi:hypothetical protein